MITSNGEQVVVITARVAQAVSVDAKRYTDTQYAKADIMNIINRDMNIGYDCSWWRPRIGEQLEQEIIDWLVSLGYLVWHQEPRQVQWNAPSKDGVVLAVLNYKTEYKYSIYWRFPEVELADHVKPFAPGERWWDHREDNAKVD